MSLPTQSQLVDESNELRQALPNIIETMLFYALVPAARLRRTMYHVRKVLAGTVQSSHYSSYPEWLREQVVRTKNMPNIAGWKKTIEIQPLLQAKDSSLQDVYLQLVLTFDVAGELLPDMFHVRARQAIATDDVDIFDLAMEVLYLWADDQRIWLGT